MSTEKNNSDDVVPNNEGELSLTINIGGVQKKFNPITEANIRANRLPRPNAYDVLTQVSQPPVSEKPPEAEKPLNPPSTQASSQSTTEER